MNIIEEISEHLLNTERINSSECELATKLTENSDVAIMLLAQIQVCPNLEALVHAISHLIIESYQLGVNSYIRGQEIKELQKLYHPTEGKK